MIPKLRIRLARISALKVCQINLATLRRDFGLSSAWLGGVVRLVGFWREFVAYRRLVGDRERCDARDAIPSLKDRTETTPVEPVYFVQDTWCAGRIAARCPSHHVDVGSSAKTMALIAQFVPVTMVDIRPVPLAVSGFSFLKGTILALPFADGSVSSLSSICVIEHIGLGRYGDPMDVCGTVKAAMELHRVLAPGGDLYVSVPVDGADRVYFNAHRAFTRARVMEMFAGLDLIAEQYLYGLDVVSEYASERGFGTGMFHFQRARAP